MYEKLNVAFLLDESDTISVYEDRGKQKIASAAASHQQGIDAFVSSLGRVQQIELLHGELILWLYYVACFHSLHGSAD